MHSFRVVESDPVYSLPLSLVLQCEVAPEQQLAAEQNKEYNA